MLSWINRSLLPTENVFPTDIKASDNYIEAQMLSRLFRSRLSASYLSSTYKPTNNDSNFKAKVLSGIQRPRMSASYLLASDNKNTCDYIKA